MLKSAFLKSKVLCWSRPGLVSLKIKNSTHPHPPRDHVLSVFLLFPLLQLSLSYWLIFSQGKLTLLCLSPFSEGESYQQGKSGISWKDHAWRSCFPTDVGVIKVFHPDDFMPLRKICNLLLEASSITSPWLGGQQYTPSLPPLPNLI